MRNQKQVEFQKASSLPSTNIEFGRIFRSFDRDGDGKISSSELRLCMASATGESISNEDAASLVSSVDSDGDGLLNEEEFVQLVHVEEGEEERIKALRKAFGMYEMEGEGCITPVSLNRMLKRLGELKDLDECRAMICRFDLNRDGVISFDEFRVMMMV